MAKTVKKVDEEKFVETAQEEVTQTEYKPLNLEEQITVKSIAGWTTGFSRLLSIGDVTIPPRGVVRLSRGEVITQVQSGNKLFGGYGENPGDHATLIIEDDLTLRELGMENAKVFSDKVVKDIFAITGYEAFLSALKEKIQTRAEKYSAMVSIIKLGLNDYSKIRAFEEHTGYKMEKVKGDELRTR